ncbi:PAS domain S-box protein, partial [Myxococcota bacterium]
QLKTEVAERKRAEEQAAIFQKFAEASGQGLGMADLDGKTTYLNPAVCRFMGMEGPEEGIGRHIGEFHPEQMRERLSQTVVPQAMENGEWVGEMPLLHKNGGPVPMILNMFVIRDEKGKPHRIAAVLTDIAERKEVEKKLEEEQQRLLTLLDGINEVCYVSDPDTYEILFANKFLRDAFGRPLVGGICYKEFQGFDEPCEFCTNDKILANPGELYQWEHDNPVLNKDFLVTDRIIKWPDGRDVRFEVAIDITERKTAERALAESEAKYRALFENSVVGQFRVAVGGKMLDANRAMAEMFGWDDLELFVAECDMASLWVNAEDRARMYAIMKELGELDNFETAFFREDGTTFPVRVSSKMYPEYGYQEGIVVDISEEKAALKALEESERKFRSLAETTSAHITIIQDDRYVYANQAFLDYFEMDSEDLLRVTPEDLMMGSMSPETIKRATSAWQAAQKRGDTHLRFEYQDAEGIWFQTNVTMMELDGRPSFMGMTFDITELKLAQQKVEENEKRYRTIFDTAGTGMISFGEDSVITVANEEWAKLAGYSIDETVGKLTWMPFFTEQSLVTMRKYHEMRTQDPTSVPRAYEAQFVDREGKIHDGIVNIQIVPGTQQRVASFQDMTELKRAQNEMYRADKMAALGQIIAGVAHEINNPNNFIYFNLPILRKYMEAIIPLLDLRHEEDPDLKILNMPYDVFLQDVFKLLENMEHGSKRITSIVSDLKSYVRSDEDQDRKTEQVGEAIERVMTLVGKQVRKMVKRFEIEVAESLPPVQMNIGKIEQVLINLLINAGHAADKEDSWVKLSARPSTDNDAWVELQVEDNGSGIPEDNLEQIFEPFFTSKGRDQGTGLGLSISQRIIEEHGGKIRVESKLGQGTCFFVLLPAVKEG